MPVAILERIARGMGFNFFSLAAGMAVLYDASGRDAKTESSLVEICRLWPLIAGGGAGPLQLRTPQQKGRPSSALRHHHAASMLGAGHAVTAKATEGLSPEAANKKAAKERRAAI